MTLCSKNIIPGPRVIVVGSCTSSPVMVTQKRVGISPLPHNFIFPPSGSHNHRKWQNILGVNLDWAFDKVEVDKRIFYCVTQVEPVY
jgi:hypothetical protein